MRRRLSGRKPPILALGTIAASTLMLSGCGDDTPSQVMFTSVDQCVAGGMDQQVCQTAYQDAMRAHLATAPHFNGMAACEAEYGAGHCVEQAASSTSSSGSGGSGNFFVPFLTGYMISSAVNNIGDYYTYRRREEENGNTYGATPVYRNRSGQTVTTTFGRSGVSSGTTTIAPSRESMKPVNVNTRTVSRQGFGGRSSFSFGG